MDEDRGSHGLRMCPAGGCLTPCIGSASFLTFHGKAGRLLSSALHQLHAQAQLKHFLLLAMGPVIGARPGSWRSGQIWHTGMFYAPDEAHTCVAILVQRAVGMDDSQHGASWDPHTGFKMAGTRQGPPPLAALLRQRMALQQQVRPDVTSGLTKT